MSFFEDASLVLIPSAIKDQKIYSIKPTDGSGDLTFTRASNATRVGPDGLIEKERANLLTWSNDFSNWTKTDVTATSGQSGYDGSSDAWLLTSTGTGNNTRRDVAYSGVNSFSIYAKAGTADGIRLRFDAATDKNLFVDLTDGSVITGVTTAFAYSVEAVGATGWYRVTATDDLDTGINVRVLVIDGTGAGTTGTIYIQDAQVNYGLVAQEYQETTTTPVSTGPVSGVPRLDYLNSSCPRLLLEPQRTNLINQSEYIASWLDVNSTKESNYATSPEGLQNATRVVMDSATGEHSVYYNLSVTSGTQYTQSIFLKQGDGSANWRYFQFRFRSGGFGGLYGVVVDLQEGTIGYDTGLDDFGIEDYGNGWYRVWITATATTTSVNSGPVVAFNELSNAYDVSIVGDTNADVLLYGAQWEAGSYPTSLIPTYGTSVTRVADAAFKTGIGSLFGANAGTIYFETTYYPEANTGSGERWVYAQGDTSNDYIRLWQDVTGGTKRIRALVAAGGVQQVNISSLATELGLSDTEPRTIKFAFAYADNDFRMYVNGNKREDTAGTAPTLTEINFNNTFQTLMPLAQALVFPTALTDAQAIELTSL